MELIDTRVFLVINTTDYNNDCIASYAVVRGEKELENYGWGDADDCFNITKQRGGVIIDKMGVGEIVESEINKGAFLMRIG